ncbi:hypothetical protein LOK49_LG09G00007 [Camellia lanceoleosa]|uniref:Uncharacterized protein n=1 Tax=Camellia lanceoleosa TaxID=1840588 RepID=A0ACC0GGQ4_9ERIC|nr:hypothetical protein LOK49_LG09G00007 [Camellia lanceoleosa]
MSHSLLLLLLLLSQIDSVADEVERQKSANDLVFIYGGVGPLHSDVTVSGVKRHLGFVWYALCVWGVCAPDEEFEEYLRHL